MPGYSQDYYGIGGLRESVMSVHVEFDLGD